MVNFVFQIKLLISKGELKENIQEIFEDKLRDFSLKNDPNFRWCAHVSNELF